MSAAFLVRMSVALGLVLAGTGRGGAEEPRLVAGPPSGSQIPLSWDSVPGRLYRIQTAATLQSSWDFLPASATPDPILANGSTMSLTAPAAGVRGFYRLVEDYYVDPAWAEAQPLRVVTFTYNAALSPTDNGVLLRQAMLALVAGDRLEIGAGTYSIVNFTDLSLHGTAANPIWIVAAPAAAVIITRPNEDQNVLNLGLSGSSYLALRGLEITGGSIGLRVGNCQQVWIDRCTVHHTGDGGIVVNSAPTNGVYITRNFLHHIGTSSSASAIYLGGVGMISSQSVVALNRVMTVSGFNGFGIQVRDGSWGNLVAGNEVGDCGSVAIWVQGTGGNAVNVVENNICLPGADRGLQVVKECVVRNNLVFGAAIEAFANQLSFGNPASLTVVHNTFISTGNAARLFAWGSGTGNVFANNACYAQTDNAVLVTNGGVGGTVVAGLVTFGAVSDGVPVAAVGTGLADFVNVTWDGASRDATPAAGSPLRGAAAGGQATVLDVNYRLRTSPLSSGAVR